MEETEAEDLVKDHEQLKQEDPENLLDDDLSNGDEEGGSDDGFINNINPDHSNYFKLKLKPSRVYHFELLFTPLQPKLYKFHLPLQLENFGKLESLRKPVMCCGIAPQFLIQPLNGLIEFKKKTITTIESSMNDVHTVSISNPDGRNVLFYYIDIKEIEKDNVFSLSQQEGIVEPHCTSIINIMFKPVIPGNWEVKLPLFLNEDRIKPKTELTIKGESAFPRVLYDRREVILPVVPLNTESKCCFRIINDGYQSVNLNASVNDDGGNIPVSLLFPDGLNLGINKTK